MENLQPGRVRITKEQVRNIISGYNDRDILQRRVISTTVSALLLDSRSSRIIAVPAIAELLEFMTTNILKPADERPILPADLANAALEEAAPDQQFIVTKSQIREWKAKYQTADHDDRLGYQAAAASILKTIRDFYPDCPQPVIDFLRFMHHNIARTSRDKPEFPDKLFDAALESAYPDENELMVDDETFRN